MMVDPKEVANSVEQLVLAKASIDEVARGHKVLVSEVEAWLNALLNGAPQLADFLKWVYKKKNDFASFSDFYVRLTAEPAPAEPPPDSREVRGLLAMAICGSPMWRLAGLPQERKSSCVRAVDALRIAIKEMDAPLRIELYRTAGLLYYKSGDLVRARHRYTDALKDATAADDVESMVRVRTELTEILRVDERLLGKAQTVAHEAIRLLENWESRETYCGRSLRARMLHELGAVLQIKGENSEAPHEYFKDADRTLTEALKLAENISDHIRVAHIENSLGAVWENWERAAKRFETAKDHYEKALLVLTDSVEDRDEQAQTLLNLGRLHSDQSAREDLLQQAEKYFDNSIEICNTTGNERIKAEALFHKASVHDSLGKPLEAVAAYEKCLLLSQEMEDGLLVSRAIRALRELHLRRILLDPRTRERVLNSLNSLAATATGEKRIWAWESILAVLGLGLEAEKGRERERKQAAYHDRLARAYQPATDGN